MSDADDQMGGHGGDTGKDPAKQTNEAPDPKTGNMDQQEQEEERQRAGKTTGQQQAAVNQEDDPSS